MNINWGTAITLFFILFVFTLGFVLYQSTLQDESLVATNYYEKDLHYQEHFDKLTNTSLLKTKITIQKDDANNYLSLTFPDDIAFASTGTITMYHPAYTELDISYDFQLTTDTPIYKIPTDQLAKGRWKVQIDWINDGHAYYQEEEIIL